MVENKPRQFFITDDDKRIVAGWASVEIKDMQGDIVPADELRRAMIDYMAKRGGVLMYEHQNIPVGKVIQWEVKANPDTGKPGVWITAQINRGSVEDKVWEAIKEGKIVGFSIGGVGAEKKVKYKTDDGREETVDVIGDLELYEISLTSAPANPAARIEEINYYAKSAVTKQDAYMLDECDWRDMLVRFTRRGEVARCKVYDCGGEKIIADCGEPVYDPDGEYGADIESAGTPYMLSTASGVCEVVENGVVVGGRRCDLVKCGRVNVYAWCGGVAKSRLRKDCMDRYKTEDGRFKEMTCPDNPDEKNRFCGCVRAMMNCRNMSLERAQKLCGWIRWNVKGKSLRKAVPYRIDVVKPTKIGEGYDRNFILVSLSFRDEVDKSFVDALIACVETYSEPAAVNVVENAPNIADIYIYYADVDDLEQGMEAVDGCVAKYNVWYMASIGAVASDAGPGYFNPTYGGEAYPQKVPIGKPFAGFKDFDDCVRHMKEQYSDKYSGEKLEEVAHRVCGKLYWEHERGRKKTEKADDVSECRKRYTWRDSEGNTHFEAIRCDLIPELVEEQPSYKGKELPFCGCIREKMECEGYSYEEARGICAAIFFGKSLKQSMVTKETGVGDMSEEAKPPAPQAPQAEGPKGTRDKLDELAAKIDKLVEMMAKLVEQAQRGATSAEDAKKEEEKSAKKIVVVRRKPVLVGKRVVTRTGGEDKLARLERIVAVLAKRVANLEARLAQASVEKTAPAPVKKDDGGVAATPRPVQAPSTAAGGDEIRELLRKAARGDQEAVQKLKELMKDKVTPKI